MNYQTENRIRFAAALAFSIINLGLVAWFAP
jgi:hypothetical protein